MTETHDGLEAFARRQRPDLNRDELIDEFHEEVNRLRKDERKPTISRPGAEKTLRKGFDGGGIIDRNRRALSKVLRCDVVEVKRRTTRRFRSPSLKSSSPPADIPGVISRIQSYGSWQDDAVSEMIVAAAQKLVFVDTWFDEGTYFWKLIRQRKQRFPGEKLQMDLYLLKNDVFGGQRLGEIRDLPLVARRAHAGALEENYKTAFEHGINEARDYLRDDTIELRLFGYDLMPGLRLMIIDDENYIFSWFPVGGMSVGNVCFCLSAASTSESDKLAIESVKGHIAAIQRNSSPIETNLPISS